MGSGLGRVVGSSREGRPRRGRDTQDTTESWGVLSYLPRLDLPSLHSAKTKMEPERGPLKEDSNLYTAPFRFHVSLAECKDSVVDWYPAAAEAGRSLQKRCANPPTAPKERLPLQPGEYWNAQWT